MGRPVHNIFEFDQWAIETFRMNYARCRKTIPRWATTTFTMDQGTGIHACTTRQSRPGLAWNAATRRFAGTFPLQSQWTTYLPPPPPY